MHKRWIKVNENSIIEAVAYLDQETPELLNKVNPGNWIVAGHEGDSDAKFRFAEVGFIYDEALGACYEMQPYPSWTPSLDTFQYEAPVDYPYDGVDYSWDEASLSWVAN